MRCLEGPIRWRMGWPHVAGRGGPRHTRTRANFGISLYQCSAHDAVNCLTVLATRVNFSLTLT